MPDADANRSRLLYRTETTFGEALPTNPAMSALRFTADTIKPSIAAVVSNEIRSDMMRSQQLQTGYNIGGGFAFEFSDGTYDPFMEALLHSTFTSSVLKNGTAAQKYFQMERGMMDVTQFLVFRDMTPNTMNLVIPSRGIVTGDFGFMGVTPGVASGTSMLGTGTLTPITTSPIMSAGAGVQNVNVNGASIGVGVREIRLSINASLREREVVDALASRDFGRGAFDIGGSIRMYFSTVALYNYFIANTSFALAFTISDLVSKKYTFLMPNCQLSDSNEPVSAIDTDIEQTVNFKAFADTGISAAISITKASF